MKLLTYVGMTAFGAFIGVVVGGSVVQGIAGAALGFVLALVVVLVDKTDPKQ